MQQALETLIEEIKADYYAYTVRDGDYDNISETSKEMIRKFNDSISIKEGRNYFKIISNKSVWGFVVKKADDKKFKQGDILKAAGWSAPARNHARGNVFGVYEIQWTGPNYM